MLSEQVRLLQRILGISRIMTFATWDCHRVGRLQAVNKSETLNTQESNRARRMSWHNIEPQALPLVVPQSQPFPKLSQIIFPAHRPLPSVRRYELNQMWFNKNTDYHAGNCQIPYTLPIWGIIAYFLAQNLTSKNKTVATSAHEIFCEGVCGEFHLLQFLVYHKKKYFLVYSINAFSNWWICRMPLLAPTFKPKSFPTGTKISEKVW